MANALFRGRSKTLMIILNIIGLAAAVMLVLKVPFGYGTTDECYYLVSPLKVLGGDAMLKDEWFIAQLSGFILMPVLKIYLLIAQSTEGILLAFRYIFVTVKILAAVFIYRRLKRTGYIFPAFVASLLFLIYTPYDILGFSYNTIGHICMCMAMAIMATLDVKERAYAILAGVLYAAAVLCCPYLAVMYVIYTIFIICTRRATFAKETGALRPGTWVRTTIGIAGLAVIFVIFLLINATPAEIITSLPHVLDDPSHPKTGIFAGIKSYVKTIIMWDKKRLAIFLLLAVICAVLLFVKKARKFRLIAFVTAAVLTLLYVFLPGYMFDMANHYILPLNIFGFVCFFLTDRKYHRMFWGMWIPGLIYSFVIFLSSNQGFYVISSATIVAAPASILFITEAAADIAGDLVPANVIGTITGVVALLLMAFQISAVAASAWEHCCWDENRSTLATKGL